MRIAIVDSHEEIARLAADRVVEVYRNKPDFVLGLATGSSPIALYDELVRRYEAGEISFAKVRSFNLDEYVGLAKDHVEGYMNFIRRHLVDRVDMPEGAAHGPDGWAEDLREGARLYDEAIKEAGGIDIQVLGIGSDGHIGFNEPGGSLSSRTHVGVLTEQTRRDNARFFDGDIDKVPTHCVTQGVGTIMEARAELFIATGKGKARAVKEMIEGAVSQRWPASALQYHDDVLVLLDEDAASELELVDFYKEVWAKENA